MPGNVYIGAAEMLGGALICVLGLAFPPAGAAGLVVVGDGLRRVLDGLNDLNEFDRNAVLRK